MLFDAYGKLVSTPTYQRQTVSLSPECPFQYKGQVGYISPDLAGKSDNPGLGLVNCMNRWYDPLSGRWISRDPAGLEGGENAYEYCDGNPLTRVDPTGLDSVLTVFGFEFHTATLLNSIMTGDCAVVDSITHGLIHNEYYAHQPHYGTAKLVALPAVFVVDGLVLNKVGAVFKVGTRVGDYLLGSKDSVRVFWAGGAPAMKMATEVADEVGGITIGTTRAGAFANRASVAMKGLKIPWKYERPVWAFLSKLYASRASGTAIFVKGNVAEDSIWETVERPLLERMGIGYRVVNLKL